MILNNKIIDRVSDSLKDIIVSKEDNEIKSENFREINEIKTKKKIVFIDAGNAEIITAPDFSLQFVRVCCIVYKSNLKIKYKLNEFFTFVIADQTNFKTRIFGDIKTEEDLLIFDKSLEIKEINNCIRRCAELMIAIEIITELDKGDVIVLDGNFEGKISNEIKYLIQLFNRAKENNIIVSALAKTCSLRTKKGNSFTYLLNKVGNGKWYYFLKENDKFNTYFIKLNEKSEYVFRFDIINDFELNLILGLLSSNSKDPVFLGYPYGLIEADKIARVSNNEKEYLRTRILTKIGNKKNIVKQHENALSSHSILDRLSF
jgi:hypothetical protein